MAAIFYACLTSLATVLGGVLPNVAGLRRVQARYLVAFAAGTMIGIAFFDMLPEVAAAGAGMVGVAVGFFTIYLVEKFVLLHACSEPDGECEAHSLGWPAMIGVAAESLTDGIAIAIGYALAPALGATIAVAVVAHELPRGFSTTVIMQHAGRGSPAVAAALLVDAGFTPLGAAFGLLVPPAYLGAALAFAAGAFLYVGAADLLPQAHQRFNSKIVMAVMAGVALMYVVARFTALH